MIFVVCVMLSPHVQKKIHEELDSVVGDGRLPSHNDRASLVYLYAAWKEAARWRPTAPISMYCLFFSGLTFSECLQTSRM